MSSDVTYSVAFGGLSFTDSSATYKLVDFAVADVKWRRVEVTAPYVDGSTVLAEVQDVTAVRLVIRCVGGGSNAGTLYNALLTASAALPGDLAVTLAGESLTYKARPADVQLTAAFEDLLANQRLVSLTFPVQPYPS